MSRILCVLLAALMLLLPLAPVRAAEQEPLVRAAADITEPTLFAPNGAPLDLQLAFAEGVIHLYMNLNRTPATFLFERTAN